MTPLVRRVVDIRRHPLGPRVYVAGRRVHECTAGVVAAAGLALAMATHHAHHHVLDAGIGLAAAWMIAKDWPDFFPSRRDTYSWRVGLHRRAEAQPVVSRPEHDLA